MPSAKWHPLGVGLLQVGELILLHLLSTPDEHDYITLKSTLT